MNDPWNCCTTAALRYRTKALAMVVAPGGAVGVVLDEALFISSLLHHAAVWQPRRYRRRRQDSIAASHAPSLAVPCADQRIPRCGRRPAKLIKFTLGLQWV